GRQKPCGRTLDNQIALPTVSQTRETTPSWGLCEVGLPVAGLEWPNRSLPLFADRVGRAHRYRWYRAATMTVTARRAAGCAAPSDRANGSVGRVARLPRRAGTGLVGVARRELDGTDHA